MFHHYMKTNTIVNESIDNVLKNVYTELRNVYSREELKEEERIKFKVEKAIMLINEIHWMMNFKDLSNEHEDHFLDKVYTSN